MNIQRGLLDDYPCSNYGVYNYERERKNGLFLFLNTDIKKKKSKKAFQ